MLTILRSKVRYLCNILKLIIHRHEHINSISYSNRVLIITWRGIDYTMKKEDISTYVLSIICQRLIKNNEDNIFVFSKDVLSTSVTRDLIEMNIITLYMIDSTYQTSEICQIAFDRNVYIIDEIDDKFKTEEMCIIACITNIYLIEHVPTRCRTYSFFLSVAKESGYILPYIPKKYKTIELCNYIINHNIPCLEYLPSEYKNYKLCLSQVSKFNCLDQIPHHYRTHELYYRAIFVSGDNIRFVPDSMKTIELCELSIIPSEDYINSYVEYKNHNPHNLRYIPKVLWSKRICKYIVEYNTARSLRSIYGNPKYEFFTLELLDEILNISMKYE